MIGENKSKIPSINAIAAVAPNSQIEFNLSGKMYLI